MHLLRVWFDQVGRSLDTAARLFDQAEAGTLPANEAKRAAVSLRELASQSRQIKPMVLPPAAPSVM